VYAARFAIFFFCLIAQVALGDLQATVESIVRSSNLGGGTASVCVIDTQTGEIIAELKSTTPMIPASNQKLLTAGAALHVLGPEFTFNTRLVLDGDNLTIIGDGDPTIGDPELLGITDWSTENKLLDAQLQPWVDAIESQHVNKINTLYVDDRIFDQNFVHPSWPANQINNWYCAQVSGLNYHLNVVHFYPSPRKGTTSSLGDIAPRMSWITFGNKTSSKLGKNSKSSFWIARLPNTNNMTARGNVNAKHTVPVKVAFHDPAIVLGNTLADLLRKNGIAVGKVQHVVQHELHTDGYIVYTHVTPLQIALQRSNTDSHNMYAESLLKRISAAATKRSGTFDEGANVVETVMKQRLNETLRGTVIADGSGMSRDNKISTKILARWLASFDLHDPAGQSLVESLATPGSGTLENRFKGIDFGGATVHAKSGYLRGVCSLSGYITFDHRDPLVFSVIVNNIKGTVKEAKKMQERIVFASLTEININ